MHIPVLLHEVITQLGCQPGKFIIDGTLDGGGHAHEIIARIMPDGLFLGVDWDSGMVARTQQMLRQTYALVPQASLQFAHSSYEHIGSLLREKNLPLADGVLLDLGFSSLQMEDAHRGMSFQNDGPLDMRYDIESGEPASVIVNTYREEELADMIWKYGEERFSRRIARAIVDARMREKIMTTGVLAQIIFHAMPSQARHGKINPATKTFQALRIFVNHELDNLSLFLASVRGVVRPGGRVAIITFHSLEDRMVKHTYRDMQRRGWGTVITKKPIIPSENERSTNRLSRSAKLRVIEIQ